mmetsp:Transcript_106694/g.180137  ORF Transcript_106694/g.180137 Transcript_106694/m.180137 type:complete len:139 (+) Transcript_106694:513-929(+)
MEFEGDARLLAHTKQTDWFGSNPPAPSCIARVCPLFFPSPSCSCPTLWPATTPLLYASLIAWQALLFATGAVHVVLCTLDCPTWNFTTLYGFHTITTTTTTTRHFSEPEQQDHHDYHSAWREPSRAGDRPAQQELGVG